MTPSEMRLKFSNHHLEVNVDYPLNSRVLFQGEGEIVDEHRKNVGEDGRYLSIKSVQPLITEFRESQGIYTPQRGEMVGKSPSKRLRDSLFIYWDQQLSTKYPDFEIYYEAAMDKITEEVKRKII